MAHHSDVGGIAPGSIAVHATEIYQEGLRIPLSKLVDAGVENTMLLRLIEANTRQPVHVLGDLRAQLAACRVGERGLTALIERYGADAHDYMDELQRVAERMMRAELAKLPDGVHAFTDYIDGVGDEPVPIPICVRVEIAGDEVLIDFEGTSPQVEASVNCPVGMVLRGVLLRHPRHRPRPRSRTARATWCRSAINAPAGTVVNPVLPGGVRRPRRDRLPRLRRDHGRARADRARPRDRGRRGRADADRAAAATTRSAGRSGTTEVLVGSWGARATLDGLEGVSNPLANLGNQPVELIEADLPLRLERYGLVPDSGGAGRQRGGLAYVREYELLARPGDADDPHRSPRPSSLRPRRRRARRPVEQRRRLERRGARAADDADGGASRSRRATASPTSRPAAAASAIPFERDPAAVLEDVLDGKVSVAAARERYGVVIADGRRRRRGDRASCGRRR